MDFAKDEEEKEEDKEDNDDSDDEENSDEEEDKKDKYSLLEQQYEELSTQYAKLKEDFDSLKEHCDALDEYKIQVENEKKDALINDFYMLSEEDKKEVIENKAQYTLEEIKAKLAVICYEKKVNFNSEDSSEIDNNIEQETITLNFDNSSNDLPDWVKAVIDN